jgi:hypothetical protein
MDLAVGRQSFDHASSTTRATKVEGRAKKRAKRTWDTSATRGAKEYFHPLFNGSFTVSGFFENARIPLLVLLNWTSKSVNSLKLFGKKGNQKHMPRTQLVAWGISYPPVNGSW